MINSKIPIKLHLNDELNTTETDNQFLKNPK